MGSPSKSNPASPKSNPGSPKSSPGSPKSNPGSPKEKAGPATTTSPTPGLPPTVEHFLPASHWTDQPVEPDDDGDSAYGEDAASSTASLTSSILHYRTINGRTYHADRGSASYWAANDELQSEAMDLLSHLCLVTLGGKLHTAPLDANNLHKALDIGTGTGSWAMDFADQYPECEVIGTDLSPIQPSWVPANLKFEIEDCTDTWTFPDNTFDYVHLRLLYGSIPDWEQLFNEAYRVLKPGGWIETRESTPSMDCDDGSVPETAAIHQWGKFFYEYGRRTGRTFSVIYDDIQRKNIERLGMKNIKVTDLKNPFGAWPKDDAMKEVGRIAQACMEDAEGWLTFVARDIQGWTKEEVTIFCAHVRRELRNTKYHSFTRHRIVIGQKPEDAC